MKQGRQLRINLSNENLYEADEFVIDKKCTFIFGNNGTGKSTLSEFIKTQFRDEYDVRLFNGFNGVISEDQKLNAVLLGEENAKINEEIKNIEKDISGKQRELEKIEEELNPEIDNSVGQKRKEAKEKLERHTKNINAYYTKSAAEIKKQTNPSIAKTSYNIADFKKDKEMIVDMSALSEQERNTYVKILEAKEKIVHGITYREFNPEKLKSELEAIVNLVLTPPNVEIIQGKSEEEKEFMQMGLNLHDPGDSCTFCANLLTRERYEALKSVFDTEEAKKQTAELKKLKKIVEENRDFLLDAHVDAANFYPNIHEEIDRLKVVFDSKKNRLIKFYDNILDCIDKKIDSPYSSDVKVGEIEVPEDIAGEIDKYNAIVKQNNDSNLLKKKEDAKEKLRLDAVSTFCSKPEHEQLVKDELIAKEGLKYAEERVKEKVEQRDEFAKQIKTWQEQIRNLAKDTMGEEVLVEKINNSLKFYTDFSLHYLSGKNSDNSSQGSKSDKLPGYYVIKDNETGKLRNVTELSTGEKNVIAFLYYINKIDEIQPPLANKKKILIIDDVMTSNDNTMQYLIMDELKRLIKDDSKFDYLVSLTHNQHFYINFPFGRDRSYKEKTFLHLRKTGRKISFNHIDESKKDFKTSYQQLWLELNYLYGQNDARVSNMILNPIRRIIETFLNFNNLTSDSFYDKVPGAKKLFDVNSHAIDDFEADANGKEKEKIAQLMRDCFEQSGAIEHFNKYQDMFDTPTTA
ncbi:AAA family ATPase [Actinotignum urinale]|uniref:AAA family ATPase n=1 Tax=Actinotignum urinale TaxID=190146 RepID=A0ABU5G6M4_9ACTO|nr:AAA family ATPase [Actinotignum urinale]MDY5132996.1 AAA family ATPase [Actinotignum urinale]